MRPQPPSATALTSRLIVALLALGCLACNRAPARLVLEPAEVHVQRSEESDHSGSRVEITLRNAGGRPLKIEDIDPRCACTIATPLAKNVLAPGETVPLTLDVNVPAFGNVDATVLVYSNAPDTPTAELLIHTHGKEPDVPRIVQSTSRLELHGRGPHAAVAGEVEVTTNEATGEAPWVRGLQSSTPDVFAAEVEEPIDVPLGPFVQRTYRFMVQGLCSADAQSVATLRPVVSAEQEPLSSPTIAVVLRCAPVVRAIPDAIELGLGLESAGQQRRVALVADDDTPFRIESIESPAGVCVTVANEISEPGNVHVFVVRIEATEADGTPLSGTPVISFTTSHAECPRVRVPVRIVNAASAD